MQMGRLFHGGGERVTVLRVVLAVLLATGGLSAQAQAQVKPKEFYFDQDAATAREIVVVEGEGDALAAELVKARERGRRQMEATAQLAHVAMSENRADLGKSLYGVAVQGTQASSGVGRSVRWNYAWDLYRNGDLELALDLWSELSGGFGAPSWVPPTMALALWSLDRKPEAVQWYAAAVRTEPDLWGNPANFAALLPDWREEDRKRLAEVYAAWQASPPSWP
jgi:hypothetical protein